MRPKKIAQLPGWQQRQARSRTRQYNLQAPTATLPDEPGTVTV